MNTSVLSKPRIALMASLLSVAPVVQAAVVCNTAPVPINVPQTTAGVYINLVTGVTGTTPATAVGWDFNPWGSTTLYWGFPTTPATSHGYVSDGTVSLVLSAGATIGPAQTYLTTASTTSMAPWRAGVTGGFLGLRFYNEGTATINYGWLEINTGVTTGYPASIVEYCYDDTGAEITAGTVPVELQSFSVE